MGKKQVFAWCDVISSGTTLKQMEDYFSCSPGRKNKPDFNSHDFFFFASFCFSLGFLQRAGAGARSRGLTPLPSSKTARNPGPSCSQGNVSTNRGSGTMIKGSRSPSRKHLSGPPGPNQKQLKSGSGSKVKSFMPLCAFSGTAPPALRVSATRCQHSPRKTEAHKELSSRSRPGPCALQAGQASGLREPGQAGQGEGALLQTVQRKVRKPL